MAHTKTSNPRPKMLIELRLTLREIIDLYWIVKQYDPDDGVSSKSSQEHQRKVCNKVVDVIFNLLKKGSQNDQKIS